MNRKHTLSKKAPLLSMFLSCCLGTLAAAMAPQNFGPEVGYLISSAYALAALFLFNWWFSPQFKGCFRLEIPFQTLLTLLIPFGVKTLLDVIATAVEAGWYFHPTVLSLCMAIVAGFGEEVMFRGLLVPIGMGFLKKHRVFLTVFTSSVIFGAMHLFNAGSGAGMTLAILQAVATTFAGVFLAAIYLRSGSVLVPIVLHGVYDWICFVTDPTLDNGIMTGDVTLGLVLAVLIDIALGIAAIYLLRPAVNGEIEALWDAKWGKTGED